MGFSAKSPEMTADGGSILVDYNMQENYGTDLQTSHIGDGSHGSDGRYVGGDAVTFMQSSVGYGPSLKDRL
jgi:hypothetical protein